jgi:PEGA domain
MTNKPRLTKALFLTILAALLFASASGHAAPKGASKRSGNPEANEAVRRGVELLAKKDYQGALAAFREAREIEPTTMSAAQIAFVHIGMERWLEANGELEEVLAESGDPWVAAHQAQLKESLAMVQKHIGSLRVRGTPEGAKIKFRSETVGLLPMRSPVQVVAGRGMVQVRMNGYESAEKVVEVAAGETADVEMSLVPVAAPVVPLAAAPVNVVMPAPIPPAPTPSRWIPWTLVGVGLAAAGYGIVALVEDGKQTGAYYVTSGRIARDRYDSKTIGVVSTTAGGLLAVGGGLWLYKSYSSSTSVVVSPSHVALNVSF